jgi:ABC-type branched-subunit amino acid transport system substrate-binding protein
MRQRQRSNFAMLLLVALCALVAFGGGCPSSAGGPSIARLPSLTSPDPQAELELREARALETAGKSEQARARYERFLVQRPKDPLVPVAQLALGRILLASDKPREASALFDSVATHPDSSVAEQGRFLGAIASARLGEHAAAVKVLEPMVGRTVDEGDTRLLLDTLAGSLLALERYAEGITVLDRACKPLTGQPRTEAQAGIDALVRERARTADIKQLYEDLPEEGCAWPSVVRRAVIDADARGDADEARDLLEVVREHDLPIDEVLSTIAMRADRPDDADPRVIGAVLSLSGKGRRVGELALRGLMLAAGLPPSGPLPKDAPQLVFRDDGGDPQRAAAAVEELATIHRAIAIIGPLDVRVAAAASDKAEQLGVPLILLTPAGALEGELVHRLFPTPEAELNALLTRTAKDNATRVAALLPAGPYGDVMSAALHKAAAGHGASVVGEQRYASGATAFGREVEALKQQAFDVLFIADQPSTIASIAPALAAAGLWSSSPGQPVPAGGRAIRVISVSAAFHSDLARSVGRYLQGALFSVPFDPLTAAGSGAAFAQAFQTRFGEPADTYAAFSHDAYRMLRAAVTAGGTTRPTLARELQRARATDLASPVTGFLPSREAKTATRLLELNGAAFVPAP